MGGGGAVFFCFVFVCFFSIQWAVENVYFSAGDEPSQKCSLFKWDLLERKTSSYF